MLRGRVVPLLGAGVNLSDRQLEEHWKEGSAFLPSGVELADHLAEWFAYPDESTKKDLLRVSQYAWVMAGRDPLYEELHDVFDANYSPTAVHRFLARLPKLMRDTGKPQYQVIVTTNYDDALEKAFEEASEEYDVVTYVAEGDNRGSFTHCPPNGEAQLIEIPNEYDGLRVDDRGNPERTVILKIHGAVDRESPSHDSFVITEDHYINYLTGAAVMPKTLEAKLKTSHVLFLGYSMRDWNLRVILQRIWGDQDMGRASWSIQLKPDMLEQRFWNRRGVEVFDIPLGDYIAELERAFDGAGSPGAA